MQNQYRTLFIDKNLIENKHMGVSLQKGNKLGAFFVSQSLPLLYMASVNDS